MKSVATLTTPADWQLAERMDIDRNYVVLLHHALRRCVQDALLGDEEASELADVLLPQWRQYTKRKRQPGRRRQGW